MNNTNNSSKVFEVRFTIVVDRPELRGASYPVVATGTEIRTTWTYASQSAAVAEMQRMLDGSFDCGSEYVAKACVWQRYTGRSPRIVRKTVERARMESDIERARALLAVAAVRRGALHLVTLSAA